VDEAVDALRVGVRHQLRELFAEEGFAATEHELEAAELDELVDQGLLLLEGELVFRALAGARVAVVAGEVAREGDAEVADERRGVRALHVALLEQAAGEAVF